MKTTVHTGGTLGGTVSQFLETLAEGKVTARTMVHTGTSDHSHPPTAEVAFSTPAAAATSPNPLFNENKTPPI